MQARLALLPLLVLVAVLAACQTPPSPHPLTERVRIESGDLQGVREAVDDGVLVFRGVPFAAPPVGELRWRPPQTVTAWDGVREATEEA